MTWSDATSWLDILWDTAPWYGKIIIFIVVWGALNRLMRLFWYGK